MIHFLKDRSIYKMLLNKAILANMQWDCAVSISYDLHPGSVFLMRILISGKIQIRTKAISFQWTSDISAIYFITRFVLHDFKISFTKTCHLKYKAWKTTLKNQQYHIILQDQLRILECESKFDLSADE